jgi:glycerol-3-phosphate dehydrogenase
VGGAEAAAEAFAAATSPSRTDRLPVPEAVSLMHPRDGRAMFAIPWEGVTIVGHDRHRPPVPRRGAVHRRERGRVLARGRARSAFPSLSELREADVITDVRRAARHRHGQEADPSKESREHAIWKEDGLLTITGGKLTTFAVMARDALGAVEAELGELEERTRIFAKPPEDVRWPSAMDEGRRIRTLGRYGADAAAIVADAALCEPIGGSIAHWAELRHAARDEGVVTLSDLLLRRVRLGLLLPRGGQDHMAEIRAVAQPELGWDDATWEREQADYAATWAKAYSLPR